MSRYEGERSKHRRASQEWFRWYATSKWRSLRKRHLAGEALCVMCKAEGVLTVATVVDHITPHKGDLALFWNPANLQSLCQSHHSSDKQRIEHGSKPRRRIAPDGWPIEPGGER